MLSLQIAQYLGIFIFVWVTSFMLHEIMHILGQGHLHGRIYVHGLGMTVSASTIKYYTWFGYSGGILTSFIMFIVAVLSTGWWQWCFLTLGWAQLCYGIAEGLYYVKYRYWIYGTVICVMLVLWMVI